MPRGNATPIYDHLVQKTRVNPEQIRERPRWSLDTAEARLASGARGGPSLGKRADTRAQP